ncbi:FMN reductase [Methylovirgula ligni]|uniref:FMN reductase n=1 Tax=Methylovirgula ligni TaxID=569860 RepID=A0A3D9YLA0_9HYPH|nr:FMN reductase [Methylovirgula ligni]QAY97397.1 FMN reductase [Methylovirgula ligni]REF83336.1 FMN reductase [Methylovirgula ligni]
MPAKVVVFSGNTHRPSKSRSLAQSVLEAAAAQIALDAQTFDLVDAGQGVGAFARANLPSGAQEIVEAIESAEALIVSVPVYKGSYPGLFKHLIDFVDPLALADKPVLLAATGGGLRHALVVEHQLRPLFGFFSALTIPTAVYANDGDFVDGVAVEPVLQERIRQAASQFAASLGARKSQTADELAHTF